MDPIAAVDPLLMPADSDLMWSLMEFLFPTSQATAWTLSMATFSSVLAMIGAMMVGTHVVLGIVHTAYSGKVLGDKFHQIWAPLRVILGFGLLVPIWTNDMHGMSSVHQLERLVYGSGNTVANAEAVIGVEYIVKEGHNLAPLSLSGRNLAKQVATSEVCSKVLQVAYDRTSFKDSRPKSPPGLEGADIVRPEQTSWLPWKPNTPKMISGTLWDYGIACGAFSFSAPTGEDFGTFGTDRKKAVGDLIKEIRELDIGGGFEKFFAKVEPSHIYDVSKPEANLGHIDQWASMGLLATNNLVTELNRVGDQFDSKISASAVENSAAEDMDAKKQIVDGVKTHGWFLLGTYYRALSRVSEKTFSYTGEHALYKKPDAKAWGSHENEVAWALRLIESQITADSHKLIVSGDTLAGVGEEAGVLAKITNRVSGPVQDYLTGYAGFRQDPVGDLINLGHRLLGASELSYTAGLAATGTASAVSAVTQTPQKIVEFVMVPGWWIIGASFIGGAVLAYVLPLIPYIFMIFAAVVIAMESLAFAVAGQLWAFQHMRMEGDDFVSPHQAMGYQLLFSLGLRQPITVLGFFGSNTVSIWTQNLLLKTWSLAFIGAQGNASMGLAAVAVSFVMMIYLQWHIQIRTLGLTLELPQRVAAIMGHTIAGWGDTEHGNAAIAATAGMIASQGRSAMPTPSRQKQSDKPKPNDTGSGMKTKRDVRNGNL